MNSELHPEDSATHYRAIGGEPSRDESLGVMPIEADGNVTVIKPSNQIGRLGLPQVWEHKYLLKYFILRSIRGRYRVTRMGYGWIIFQPLLLCLVYVGVFGYLVGIKTEPVPYPLFVFVGISLYLFFAGTVSATTASLISNASIMSKVYYPRLIAPLSSLCVNLLDLVASFTVVIGLMVIYGVYPGWNVVYFPLLLAGLALASFALGLVLAAHSIHRRDISMGLPVILRVMVYAMPCVYPISMVPEKLVTLYYMNPMAALIQGIRWSLLGDVAPPLWAVGSAAGLIVIGLYYGLAAFTRAERTMVDTL